MPYMSGGWTIALPKLCGTSPVIREIMLAVCLAMQGQATGSEREREEGMKYYTASLQRMTGALKDRDKVDHSTLVVATRIFSMYEVSALPSSSLLHIQPFFSLLPIDP